MSQQELAMTFVVAGVLIEKDGKFLLVQEKQPKAYKQWNLPAGKVDKGESIQQAAIREAKEEVGYDVELGDELLVMHESIDTPVLHSFEAQITGGQLQFPEDELLDAGWFTYEEITGLQLCNADYILGSIDALRSRKQ